MKRKTLLTVGVILIVICIIAILVISRSPKDYLFGKMHGICFDMTPNSLIQLKGEPEETEKNVHDTPQTKYIYREEFYDYEAVCTYYFQNDRLTEAVVCIDDVEKELALRLMETVFAQQQAVYSERKGYYCEEIDSGDEDRFSFAHGIDTGYSGITLEFSYQSGQLMLYALKQK